MESNKAEDNSTSPEKYRDNEEESSHREGGSPRSVTQHDEHNDTQSDDHDIAGSSHSADALVTSKAGDTLPLTPQGKSISFNNFGLSSSILVCYI